MSEENKGSNLIDILKDYKIVVVEGWDCVGKSFILDNLSRSLGSPVYRPDYNYWQDHDLPNGLRWLIGASLFDAIASKSMHIENKILIDRGILSGMVYTSPAVGVGYKQMLDRFPRAGYDGFDENYRVMHLIISTDEESFNKFNELRGPGNIHTDYTTVAIKTQMFIDYAKLLGVDYLKIMNRYDPIYAEKIKDKCGSCGHYSYGQCKHPNKCGLRVSPYQARCNVSNDKEVQDR